VLGLKGLARRSVALVLSAARRLQVPLIAEVLGQLHLKRPLHQPLRQLAELPPRPDDLLLARRSAQKLVTHAVRKLAADLIRHPVKDPRPGRRLA
jgi:hypothetical protein